MSRDFKPRRPRRELIDVDLEPELVAVAPGLRVPASWPKERRDFWAQRWIAARSAA